MTLQQIHYAVTVAETGSINRAANELLVSQSCLSTAIHEIEREFRITIFIRSNRGVVVTTEGEEFPAMPDRCSNSTSSCRRST